MLADEFQARLDKVDEDKKSHLSGVRKAIQERIERHTDYINSSIDLIKTENMSNIAITSLVEEINRVQVRISELEAVLEYCF